MADIVEVNKQKKHSTKDILFEKEQKNVLNKLLQIIDLKVDDDVSFFSKDKLSEKKNDIVALYEDIKKFYNANVWRSIEVSNEDTKFMCIIRRILEHHNYQLKYKKKQKILLTMNKQSYTRLDQDANMTSHS